MPGSSDERNQRVAGGSGQATPPDGCVDPGHAPAAGCCIGGGSGHWTWDCVRACGCAGSCDCACSCDGRMVMAVGPDSSFGLATTFGFGLGFGLASALASGVGSAGCACAVGCDS